MWLSGALRSQTCLGSPGERCAQNPLLSKRFLRRTHRILCSKTFAAASEVIIVGGGAAGLTAAYFAAEHGAQVQLLLQRH